MKYLGFLLVFFCVSAWGADDESSLSPLKGFTSVQETLAARIEPPGATFEFTRYGLPAPLIDLMGTWTNPKAQRVFHNGIPNAVNALLWSLNLHTLADELAGACRAPQTALNEAFLKKLKRVCAWPSSDAQSEDAMIDFWVALMGYEAPRSEFEAWRDFFLHSSYRTRPGAEAVRAMTFAIVMNPYFLLEN